MFAPEVIDATVDLLAALAGDGTALELGIGTGRIALPLSARGVRVHGVDLSRDMVEQLHAKPGSGAIEVTIGDFATTDAGRDFSLVYLVFNTVNNLTTQEEQVDCFVNAARHLRVGGLFVVEVGVPQLRQLPAGQTVHPFHLGDTHVGLDEYDVVGQGLVSHHFTKHGDEWQLQSIPFRYVWPAELDLMARIAGMALVDRFAGWDREPFTADSRSHVSVWRKHEEGDRRRPPP